MPEGITSYTNGITDFTESYIPKKLKCNREVNQEWEPGKHIECCRDFCDDKMIKECWK